jgi:hypothetical protein
MYPPKDKQSSKEMRERVVFVQGVLLCLDGLWRREKNQKAKMEKTFATISALASYQICRGPIRISQLRRRLLLASPLDLARDGLKIPSQTHEHSSCF